MIGVCFAGEDGDLPENGLLDKPVLFCRGQFDDVIPRHKFEQAEAYLSGPSGARATFIPLKAGMNCRCRSRRRCRAGSARKAAEFRPVLGHGRTGAPDDREPAASGNDRMRPALFQDQAFAYAVIGGSPSTARLRSCTMPSSVIGRGLG